MEHITSILKKTLAKHGLKDISTTAEVITKLHQYIKQDLPNLYSSIEDISCKNAEVIIHCSHSIAVQEIQQLKPSIEQYIKSINSKSWEVRAIRAKSKAFSTS
jgi:hypothetical protein